MGGRAGRQWNVQALQRIAILSSREMRSLGLCACRCQRMRTSDWVVHEPPMSSTLPVQVVARLPLVQPAAVTALASWQTGSGYMGSKDAVAVGAADGSVSLYAVTASRQAAGVAIAPAWQLVWRQQPHKDWVTSLVHCRQVSWSVVDACETILRGRHLADVSKWRGCRWVWCWPPAWTSRSP